MKPQRILLGLLILAAVGVWSYNGLLVVDHLLAWKAASGPMASLPVSPGAALPVLEGTAREPYSGQFRDPFLPSFSGKASPDRKPTSPNRPSPKAAEKPPRLLLQGILWDAEVPLALIAGPDGGTENLGVGDTLAGVRIVSIGPDSVLCRFGTQRFTLLAAGR